MPQYRPSTRHHNSLSGNGLMNRSLGRSSCRLEDGVLRSGNKPGSFCLEVSFLRGFAPARKRAARARLGEFTRLEAPRRNFIECPARGVAVLLEEQHLRICAPEIAHERNDRTRPGVPNDFELAGGSIREAHLVDIETDP